MFLSVGLGGIGLGSADAAMYGGGTIKGATYGLHADASVDRTVLETFEKDAGKKITFINTGQFWASFNETTMQAAIDNGAIPLVTMGLPSGVTLAGIAAGARDAQMGEWAEKAKAWGYPFLFRPWWEVNGTWYSWGRDPNYVACLLNPSSRVRLDPRHGTARRPSPCRLRE